MGAGNLRLGFCSFTTQGQYQQYVVAIKRAFKLAQLAEIMAVTNSKI